MASNPTDIKLLGFVAYLFKLGEAQSSLPQPMQAAALLLFHDSAELFLRLACEKEGIGGSNIEFMGYFDELSKRHGQPLADKESMRSLNKARAALKHHATIPDTVVVERSKLTTDAFLRDNCQLLFGVEFDELSLIDFVADEEIRGKLKAASDQLPTAGYSVEAAGLEVRKAFDLMLRRFRESSGAGMPRGSHTRWMPMTHERATLTWAQKQILSGQEDANRAMGENVEQLREVVELLALGIDYPRYQAFCRRVPNSMGQVMQHHSRQDVLNAIQFVVDVALRIQALPL